MADKKMKKAEEVKTIEQLRAELVAKHADMLAVRKSHAAGELTNPRVITTTRKEIARINTAIRALELSEKESK